MQFSSLEVKTQRPCLGELELFQKLLFAEAPPTGPNSCFPEKLVVLYGVACRGQFLLREGANAEGRRRRWAARRRGAARRRRGGEGRRHRRAARRGGAARCWRGGGELRRPAWRGGASSGRRGGGARAEMWAGDGWRRSEQKLGKLVLSSFFACSVNEASAAFRWLENLPHLG